MDWLALITAFGVGTVVSTVIQSVLVLRAQNRTRSFEERKEAYIGLLEALRDVATSQTDETSNNFAYWRIRCQIIAPATVREAITDLVNASGDRRAMKSAERTMRAAMRFDLGISRK